MTAASVGIPSGGDDNDAQLPETFCGLFQRKIDFPVVGADGKIHYSDIIFAMIVHYPSKCFDCLSGVSLPAVIQDLKGNDVCLRSDALPDAVGKIAISAGDSRDMGHGCENEVSVAFCELLRYNKEQRIGKRRKSLCKPYLIKEVP